MQPDDQQGNHKTLAPEQRLFQRYVLKSIAGRGGMGVVWQAWDERLQHQVALKFLPEVILDDPIALQDLRKETKRCLQLTHPNIVRIYDFVEDGGIGAIVMEYVQGQPLNVVKAAQRDHHFEVAALHPLVGQLCDTLTYAHTDAGFVHRDVKPANLLLTEANLLKVTDFGIARNISESVSRLSVRSNDSSGTPGYMSPQQAMGEPPSISDDVYSIGATLYDLLTSRPPFFAGDIPIQILNKVPPPLSQRRTELGFAGEPIPKAWEELIAACLEKDPKARPQSTQELKRRLGDAPPSDGLDTIVLTQSPLINRSAKPVASEPLPTRPPTSPTPSPHAPASDSNIAAVDLAQKPVTSTTATQTGSESNNKHTVLLVAIGLLGVVAIGLVGILYVVLKNLDGGTDKESIMALLRELQAPTESPTPAADGNRDQKIEELEAEVEKLKRLQQERDDLLQKITALEKESGQIQQSNAAKDERLEALRGELADVQNQLDERPVAPPQIIDEPADRSAAVSRMIIAYTAAGNTGSSESQMNYFNEQVDYLTEGTLNKNQIAQDSLRYRKRFPRRSMTITEGPTVSQVNADEYQAATTSRYEFDHFREGTRATKTIGNTFVVRFFGESPLIVSIKNPVNETLSSGALPATATVASDFVKAYFADGESGQGRAQLEYYDDTVYYIDGLRSRDEIGEILDRYIDTTPFRSFRFLSEPEVLVLGKEFEVTATVRVSSGQTQANAKSRQLRSKIKVGWRGPKPKIIAIEQVN